jgi:hypothetical protein
VAATDLPHDWSIEGSSVRSSCRHWRRRIAGRPWLVSQDVYDSRQTAKGKLIFIEFDGVYRNSEVWINGHYLGKRPYGYSTFEYELTPFLIYGGEAKCHRGQGRQLTTTKFALVFRFRYLSKRLVNNARSGSRRTLGHIRNHAGG